MYHANVDYFNRIVNFSPNDQPPFHFEGFRENTGMKLISTLTARKLMNKGCEGYLDFLLEGEKARPKLEDSPIICNFPNMFLKDLSRLPSTREVARLYH